MEPGNKNNIFNDRAKLKWACRRGMLELDVLLNNFLEERYADLAIEDKQRFATLLSYPDPELFAWLMGHRDPLEKDVVRITEMIRHHARSRI